MDVLAEFRGIALRQAVGDLVGSDLLTAAALRALLAGADSPSLPILAGLTRQEENEAQDLFEAVKAELGIDIPSVHGPATNRWEFGRWLCRSVVGGSIDAIAGGRLLWWEVASPLDLPDALMPIVGAVEQWDGWIVSSGVDRERFRKSIIDTCAELLAGPWPPS